METKQIIENKLERFNFGKHKGKLISAVEITDPEYFIWLSKVDLINNISEEWQQRIKEYADNNKNKIYAGSYGSIKRYG